MPRKAANPAMRCRYFAWNLRQRSGVYFADGRSGGTNLGRHSLNTRDREEALQLLADLDNEKAIERGLAPPSSRGVTSAVSPVALEAGRDRYIAFLSRPPQIGGIKAK